jgi:hypothetical protein
MGGKATCYLKHVANFPLLAYSYAGVCQGTPGKGEGQLYGEVAGWFEATKLYMNVDQQFPTIPIQLPYNTPGIHHLLGLRPNDDTDVVLNIHAKLIGNAAADGFFAFYNNSIPNHYIGLCNPATTVMESGVEKVKFKYFSWGAVAERTCTKEEFESRYYGALVAEHRSLTDSRTSPPVWASRPSTLGGNWEDVLPDPPAPEYWYRVKAVNCIGESQYCYDVMVSVPSGTVREIHPWDADISLPPMHARQFTVVQAPAGLAPVGYARFAAPTCGRSS